ncbi:hypothetical protein BABINDRAFT_64716 [Babjeviella inositovora NRRL Y-12698]|uniref:Protein phosphatase 1 regulatory subunit 7 n=1 Tax=Babjeviella inositovora NRRL Y-12698 TaxID=984486 RepID=A0A1E3QMC8_9ASCO|nr:uncharacterized protein BABINDRAFT_64716 [Babjeviella inositovora NRRL Y-12698]ODQ78859.1 hypothetical protein BABINDRAFT_64716 [Babjeviella inositovora NRRL Y-12698]
MSKLQPETSPSRDETVLALATENLNIEELSHSEDEGAVDEDDLNPEDEPLPIEYPGTVIPDNNPESIEADTDLTADMDPGTDYISLIQLKILSIEDLHLQRFPKLEALCLRQNLITSINALKHVSRETLMELDLYDNRIDHVSKHTNELVNLTTLDFSFNKIKNIKNVDRLVKLVHLYFVQNKISEIKNLSTLTNLRNLELGGNRISKIENLDTLVNLEQLWLAKNRITTMENMSSLQNLRILSIQSNRITQISGLEGLTNLEELYISHNKLERIEGLEHNLKLTTLDVTGNKIAKLENLSHLTELTDLWASYNEIDSFENIGRELGKLPNLETVYFEGNPVQKENPVAYTRKVKLYLGPSLTKIDANYIK